MNIKTEGKILQCYEEDCIYSTSCSTHFSAGDFRSDDGFKPRITKDPVGFVCHSKYSKPTSSSNVYGFRNLRREPTIDSGYGLCFTSDVENRESNYQI